jgi:hypothetical protein
VGRCQLRRGLLGRAGYRMDDDTPSVNDLFASVEFCYFGVGMMRT